MKKEVRNRITDYIRNKRKRMRFFAVLSALSLVVALGTFYALSMPALTLDNDAVGSANGDEEVAIIDTDSLSTPSAAPSVSSKANNINPDASETPTPSASTTENASPSPSPMASDVSGADPSPSPSTVLEIELSDLASPSPSPSASPSASPSPSPSAEFMDDGQELVWSVKDLTVSVVFDAATVLPENTTLEVIRITSQNYAQNNTVNINGIESSLGVSGKGNFEYYIFKFFVDGEEIAMPNGAKTITINDLSVGKKMGAQAIYWLNNSSVAPLSEINRKNITTEKQTATFTSSNTFTGLIVYWQKGTTSASLSTASTASITTLGNGNGKGNGNGNGNGNGGGTADTQSIYEYAAGDLSVTAELSDPTAVSDDAELIASEITMNSDMDAYLSYYFMLYLNGYINSGDDFYIYDIHFELNGLEVEPTGGTVEVTLSDGDFSTSSTINTFNALHIDNSNNVDKLKVEPPGISGNSHVKFTVDSFSTFIVLPSGSRLTFDLVEEMSDTFTYSSYYIPDRPLGMAGNFHIVAFDTAYLYAHTNGNVLAQNCYASANFGTNNLAEEVSYIQNYLQVSPTSASSTAHILALGSSNVISLMDNGNAFGVNGTKLDKPYNIVQDDDTSVLQYVNMNLVESEFRSIILSFSSMSDENIDSSTLNIWGGSCDLSYITLTDPDAVGVFNITASQLNQYSYLGVKGFTSGSDGTVFINVDCSGFTGTVHIPNSEMQVDGSWLGFQERTTFIYGHILWNFINCTSDIETGRVYGTIVAPDSTIKLYQNVNGTVVGENVYVYAESHRDDFVGIMSNGITVNKIFLDEHDKTMAASAVADLYVVIQPYWSNNNGSKWHSNTNDQFELNSSNSWTYTWFQPNNKTYLWKVEEIGIYDSTGADVSGNYALSYSSNNDDGITEGLIYVYNKISYTLPDTGGVTAKPFTIVGVLMMSVALYLSFKLKRSRESS